MTKEDAVKDILALCQAKGVDVDLYDRITVKGVAGEQVDLRVYQCSKCGHWIWMFAGSGYPYHCGLPTKGVCGSAPIQVTAQLGELTRDILEAARS